MAEERPSSKEQMEAGNMDELPADEAQGEPAPGEEDLAVEEAAPSPQAEERPASGTQRPSSGSQRPPSASQRTPSGTERPPSASQRPPSATRTPSAGRPPSAGSGRPPSAGRPSSAARPPSAGARPASGSRRSGSGAQRPPSGEKRSPVPPQASPTASPPATPPALQEEVTGPPPQLEPEHAGMPEQDDLPQGYTSIPPMDTAQMMGGEMEEEDEAEEEEEYQPRFGRGGEDDYDDSEASDDESEMVVLDPEHPLMKRFQDALKGHLTKQMEKVDLEVRELKEALKGKLGDREELGVNLYGMQQELARQQTLLEKRHDQMGQLSQMRAQCEEQLREVRDMYKKTQQNVNTQRKESSALQTEVENLALHLYYMTNAKEDIRGDIAVMRRAAEKADTEVSTAEEDKQKQDLYVDRLTETVDKLREQIALYEAQSSAQGEETKAAKEALSDARMEIESINLEKKQLFQQWNSSLIGMRRRDEAHAAMQEALSQQKQHIMSLATEIEGYKKSIMKEQENNETLTLLLQKNEIDINSLRKQISTSQDRQEKIKQEYSTYSRMLHETEQALNRATTDRTLRVNELTALRKQIEREYQEKLRLEESIMDTLRNKLTMDKAAHYAKKMAGNIRKSIADQEAAKAKVENEISQDTLDLSNTNTRVEQLRKSLKELDGEIHEKNQIINRSEGEMVKRNAVIERKQGQIDQYNKKIEAAISGQGGEELGPLEQEVNALTKNIDTRTQEIADLQQFWLRQQGELVKMTQDKDNQQMEVDTMKKALTILHQKKMRIEGEIEGQLYDRKMVDKSIQNMQNDMLKLNQLLTREGKIRQDLHQDNALIENDFVLSLREAERESLEMQGKLDELGEEKERLLNSLVEAERQIMLWEKKTQLAREAKATVDSEVGQGEIRAMSAEIHRMEVRHTQLMKLQEKLIQDMEKAVSRRDTIVTRGDAQSKMNKKVETKGAFQKKLLELRKKIKETQQDANGCDNDIAELRGHQQMLNQQLDNKQREFHELQSMADTQDGDIERLVELKQKNLGDIVSRQRKVKNYQALKDGKYTLLCKTEAALEAESKKQLDKMQTVATIADRLITEFPQIQPAMRSVQMVLSSRGAADDELW
ncbi:coiled-coil domain-containing protein 40 [Strongylocentrotus purpuratus]|uniref:Coiled-coil domain-containing protein 40 n=1 Tax=Strongylocentrotus purpuratus TaxID=7668 RepID=A0A7M7NUB6_STRPU|nr:coiled-coil domain-containing protein 40 [Strongylocentrotus purpuratus]